jgi:hypothetical protein
MGMIDVFVPVLGRPRNAAPLVESFRAHSSQMDEITFICSPSDTPEIEACRATGENVLLADWEPGPADYARKMNFAFSATERPWIFLGSDDIEFSEGWSEIALAQGGSVIATNDLANQQVRRGQFGTHCLVSRAYVEEQGASLDGPGVLIHEGYDHNFVDRELCHLAQARRVYSFARDAVVRHRHPLWRTARWDATYRKGLANFQRDRDLFLTRAAQWGYVGLSTFERNVAQRRRRDIVRAR